MRPIGDKYAIVLTEAPNIVGWSNSRENAVKITQALNEAEGSSSVAVLLCVRCRWIAYMWLVCKPVNRNAPIGGSRQDAARDHQRRMTEIYELRDRELKSANRREPK